MLSQLTSTSITINTPPDPEVHWGRFSKTYNGTGTSSSKFNLSTQPVFSSHRSGWEYAIDALTPLHTDNGVLFDGFLEKNFAWHYNENVRNKKNIPYKQPWVGVLHNPPYSPDWFFGKNSLENIIETDEFLMSMKECRGIFTLSTVMQEFLQERFDDVPISTVYHPTEMPSKLFDPEKFLANDDKKIVMIGYWLRKLNSLNALPLDSNTPYRKVRLVTFTAEGPKKTIEFLINKEQEVSPQDIPSQYNSNTYALERLSNSEYDDLLTQNVVFLNLYTSSANNALIECIARGTPVLANPIPATVEYLGEDYPLFFESLDEAADKALNLDLVCEAHKYLLNCDMRQKLSQEYFLESVINSKVYSLL